MTVRQHKTTARINRRIRPRPKTEYQKIVAIAAAITSHSTGYSHWKESGGNIIQSIQGVPGQATVAALAGVSQRDVTRLMPKVVMYGAQQNPDFAYVIDSAEKVYRYTDRPTSGELETELVRLMSSLSEMERACIVFGCARVEPAIRHLGNKLRRAVDDVRDDYTFALDRMEVPRVAV